MPSTNQEALEALKRSSDAAERRALCDLLVRRNLPLVYAVTARMGRTLALPQEDLRQVGSLGLLRAIEAFDPARGRTLSSFAVPYIRGAIQHELRDRASLMRIPRPLWELRRRATVLQDRRRRLGQSQLGPAQLAMALGCSTSQVLEALQLSAVVEMRSLDAPSSGELGEDANRRTLLEQLADPASLAGAPSEAAGPAPDDPLEALLWAEPPGAGSAGGGRHELASPRQPTGWPRSPERSWLQHRLQALTTQDRQLLLGHVCDGRGWAEIGRDLNLHPRKVQRRTERLLRRLEAEARHWRDGAAGSGLQA